MKLFQRYASVTAYALVMLAMAVGDVLTGIYVSFWVLYFLPIGLATWNLGPKTGAMFAAGAVALLLATAFFFGHPYTSLFYLVWAYGSRAVAYAVLVRLVGALRKKDLERLYVAPGNPPSSV